MVDFNCVCHLFSSSGMHTPKHSPPTPQPTRQQWEGDSVLWWPSSISEKQKVALSEISIPDGGDVCYTGEKISEGSALSKRSEGSRLLELGCKASYQVKVLALEAGPLLPSTPAGSASSTKHRYQGREWDEGQRKDTSPPHEDNPETKIS